MKDAIVKINDLVLNEEMYPRMKQSWVTAYDYAESMKTGTKFPPIVVAKFNKKQYLIDGWHRVQGYKTNGVEYTEAELIKVKNMAEMFIEAVKRNMTHGRPFSFQEKVSIIDKLEKLKVDKGAISHIVGVTIEKMEKITSERVTHTVTGETLILKSPVKHLMDQPIKNGDIETLSKITGVRSQVQLLDMVISMLKNNIFNLDNKDIMKKVEELQKTISLTVR